MANLKIKKTDLKGPVRVGHGWLATRSWAVLVGEDKRLQNLETLNAAFAGLDAEALSWDQADALAKRLREACCHPQDGARSGLEDDLYLRTNVLLEDEDGALTRVFRRTGHDLDPEYVPANEAFCQILNDPLWLAEAGPVYGCPAGLIAPNTAQGPGWFWEFVNLSE